MIPKLRSESVFISNLILNNYQILRNLHDYLKFMFYRSGLDCNDPLINTSMAAKYTQDKQRLSNCRHDKLIRHNPTIWLINHWYSDLLYLHRRLDPDFASYNRTIERVIELPTNLPLLLWHRVLPPQWMHTISSTYHQHYSRTVIQDVPWEKQLLQQRGSLEEGWSSYLF